MAVFRVITWTIAVFLRCVCSYEFHLLTRYTPTRGTLKFFPTHLSLLINLRLCGAHHTFVYKCCCIKQENKRKVRQQFNAKQQHSYAISSPAMLGKSKRVLPFECRHKRILDYKRNLSITRPDETFPFDEIRKMIVHSGGSACIVAGRAHRHSQRSG